MTFELVDLEDLGEKALLEFNDCIAQTKPGYCVDFDQAVDRLVGKVEFAYGVAAKLAHREPTMEGTEAIWAKMVSICDEIGKQIKDLEGQHPSCKASFDRILDYRNAAFKRRELHS
ncbi:MAG: hypothetical protein HY360_17060 [Verrucomicrobia bacterium]|nr:hypothetical protein [Verrucomicrobiota bacterium]